MSIESVSLNPALFSAVTEITIGPTTGHVGSKDKNVGWFAKTSPELQPAARQLLEQYSRIPADKVIEHVLTIVSSLSSEGLVCELRW
jgi:hypothetical protein